MTRGAAVVPLLLASALAGGCSSLSVRLASSHNGDAWALVTWGRAGFVAAVDQVDAPQLVQCPRPAAELEQ